MEAGTHYGFSEAELEMSEIIDTFWQCMTLCATEILLKNAVMPLPLKRKVLRPVKAGAKKRPTTHQSK